MAEENAKHAVAEKIEEVVETVEEQIAPPTRRQRFVAWVKNHKVQIGVGAGAAALAGVALAAKSVVKEKTGIDLGEEIVDTVGEVIPPEI